MTTGPSGLADSKSTFKVTCNYTNVFRTATAHVPYCSRPRSHRLLSGRLLRLREHRLVAREEGAFQTRACVKDASRTQTSQSRANFLSKLLRVGRGPNAETLKESGAVGNIPKHWKRHLETLATGKQRVLQGFMRKVAAINGLEAAMKELTDEALAAKTGEFRGRLQNGGTLDDLLPEAFAVVREAARRVLNMRHYDVQLIGGMVLHEGAIAEMQTGEGKTLVATLAAYLNALEGKGVHVVTVNDYLAKRDCEWMGKLYTFLGVSVDVVQESYRHSRKRQAFNADITYLTANTLGFSFLADTSTVMREEELAILRPFHYAIVDEADSLLIDECRNPLIISSEPDDTAAERFLLAHKVINAKVQGGKPFLWEQKVESETGRVLKPGHYVVDRKLHRISLTRHGMTRVLALLAEEGEPFPAAKAEGREPNINDLWEEASPMGPYIITALRARELHKRDVNYIVRDGEVKIVNPSTGRVMPTSRWTDDLHQAIEAQEHPEVQIKGRTRTASSITYQTLFKYYTKLSGMTGTAVTEEEEFHEVYGLSVAVVPTHKPRRRIDHDPRVFLTEADMLRVLRLLLNKARSQLRPVLIGTASVADSDYVAAYLRSWGIQHQMLNARPQYIRREAKIIAQAGVPGLITIATNMAGRGTDIILGGNSKGLAQLALESIVLPSMVAAQDWEMEKHEMPFVFDNFKSLAEQQGYLPPELVGALQRVQAVVGAAYSGDVLPFHKADKLISDALDKAEALHQQLIASLPRAERDWPTFATLLPHLRSLVDANLGAHDSSEGPDVSAELARALSYLRLYFDEECAYRAQEVKDVGGLLVLVLSMQESERVAAQLRGRAGRQGDPGETFTLVEINDPLVEASGITGMDAVKTLLQKVEADIAWLPDQVGRMYINMVQDALKEGKRAGRLALLESDAVLEVFRRHKSQLRMQLLAGSPQQRNSILRAAFLDAAEWLVKANVDPHHHPRDTSKWDLATLVRQVRHVVNPMARIKLAMPRTQQMAKVWRDVTKMDAVPLQIGNAENVLGPLADEECAEALRHALSARMPAVVLREETPLGVVPGLQEELQVHLKVQRERAILEGSGFEGRWAGAAEALAEHVGAALVEAYEQRKRPLIEAVFEEYLAMWNAAIARGDRRSHPEEPGTPAENVGAFERETMIKVLDAMWSEFLEDEKSVDTAVSLRSFSHLNPLDEFRLESSDLFLKSLKRLRQQWTCDVMRGPLLAVDLDVILDMQSPQEHPPVDPDIVIGPPITDLSEGMDNSAAAHQLEAGSADSAMARANAAGQHAEAAVEAGVAYAKEAVSGAVKASNSNQVHAVLDRNSNAEASIDPVHNVSRS